MKPLIAASLFAALCGGASGVGATTCAVVASAMAFGSYDTVLGSSNNTTASVQVSCIPGVADPLSTAYVLSIAGTGTSSDSVRSIAAGAYRLYYQVYKDAGYSVVWGNGGGSGTGISSSVTSTAALTPGLRVHTAYARMPAMQAVPTGLYAGSLLLTIDY